MMASRNAPAGEPLFSPNDIARLFQLVSDIADRGQLDPSEVIEQLEHGVAPSPEREPATPYGIRMGENVVNPVRLTEWDLKLFFGADSE